MPKTSDPETWVSQYGDYLFRYAVLRVKDKTLAEDLVQETLLAALRARDRFKGTSSEKTWLVAILKHKIIDLLFRGHEEVQVEDIERAVDTNEDRFDDSGHWKTQLGNWGNPEKALEDSEFWRVFTRCVENLRPPMADVFILRELQNLSGKDLCNVLNISTTNNAWVLLSRARMRMRECLESNWFNTIDGNES